MIFIYITFHNKTEAKKIAKILLKKRLVACVNIFPIDSIYLWHQKITSDKEVIVILKTLKKNFKKIEILVKKYHKYDVPFIGMIEVNQVSREYLKWLIEELT